MRCYYNCFFGKYSLFSKCKRIKNQSIFSNFHCFLWFSCFVFSPWIVYTISICHNDQEQNAKTKFKNSVEYSYTFFAIVSLVASDTSVVFEIQNYLIRAYTQSKLITSHLRTLFISRCIRLMIDVLLMNTCTKYGYKQFAIYEYMLWI